MKEQNENNQTPEKKKKGFFAKYWWVILIACIICIAIIYYAFVAGLLCGSTQPDSFGKDHPIPASMNYDIPKEENALLEPVIDTLLGDNNLQVWNGIQGGIYNYSFFYPALPDGEVFLRCFEATENVELSASRIRTASSVEVKNHTDFGQIADMQQFTIYEGDWEEYYAARIEVWHKNASTGEETKLTEKTYRVEGWMR